MSRACLPAPLALVSHPERGDSLVPHILTISLMGVSELAAQVFKTMREHPELLSESFNFFMRLYHTYYLPARTLPLHSPMD
jgi:hypothetical protein